MKVRILIVLVLGATAVAGASLIVPEYFMAINGTSRKPTTSRDLDARQPIAIPVAPWPAAQADPDKVLLGIRKTEPYFEYRRVCDLLHALELWGKDAIFDGDVPFTIPTGLKPIGSKDMIRFLLEGKGFKERYQIRDTRSTKLLSPSPYGVREQIGEESFKSPHVDNLLAVCAEIGLSLDAEIDLGDQRFRLVDLLRDAMARFDRTQEMEFTTVAFARYLPPNRSWSDRFDRRHSFDEIADVLLGKELGQGTCYGTHTPYAMATLLRIDEHYTILSRDRRERMGDRLKGIIRILKETQQDDGSWGRQWSRKVKPVDPWEPEDLANLRATSHHLQWMAIAPERYRIEGTYAKRAVYFLLDRLLAFRESDLTLSHDYPVLSHVGHAIVLPFGCVDASSFKSRFGRDGYVRADGHQGRLQ